MYHRHQVDTARSRNDPVSEENVTSVREKRKRKSWLKNDDSWIKFVPSSFAKLVYIYILFFDIYLAFLTSKATKRFFQKILLFVRKLRETTFFFAKTFLSPGNSPR